MKAVLKVRIYGAFTCSCASSGRIFHLTRKHAALFALLAVAKNGRRTRSWLQSMLWPRSGPEHGRASLRQALAGLKRTFGETYSQVIDTNNLEVWVHQGSVELIGTALDGTLLEGLDCPGADGFDEWLAKQRQFVVVGLENYASVNLPAAVKIPFQIEPKQLEKTTGSKLRPALAVLPFLFMEGDHSDSKLGDMIASDLSRLLSKTHGIDVISHMSCRTTKFTNSDLAKLRNSYGVDYLITGVLRRSGSELLLDIDFTETASGVILDSRRFMQSKTEWLLGRADILNEIGMYIVASIFKGAIQKSVSEQIGNLEAHTLLMSAIALMHRQDLGSVLRSYQYLENIIVRFGPSSLPYAWLVQWYVLYLAQGWSTDVAADKASARRMADLARQSNPECAFSEIMSGLVSYQIERSYDVARTEFDDVLSREENNAYAWFWKGTMLAFEGKGEEAVAYTERGRFLTPLDPGGYLYFNLAGTAQLSNRDFGKALEYADRSLALNRHHASALRTKIVALHGLQRFDDARKASKTLMRGNPDFSVSAYLAAHPAGELELGKEWARALKECGIPAN